MSPEKVKVTVEWVVDGKPYVHELTFANPKSVAMSYEAGHAPVEGEGATHYIRTGKDVFTLKVETR